MDAKDGVDVIDEVRRASVLSIETVQAQRGVGE